MNVRLGAIAMTLAFCFFFDSSVFCQVEAVTKKCDHAELTVIKLSENDSVEFTVVEPDKNDSAIDLSIAAAFTTKTARISGLYICAGKKISGTVNPHLGGAAIVIDGSFRIFSNDHGKVLTQDFVAKVEKSGGSLFQQLLLVKDKVAQLFKDSAIAPRRALAVFANGERAIVQSVKKTTLGQFAHDMQRIGVSNAVYTPVGDADGGWYRDGDKIVSIGASSAPVPVQSNWVVWKRNPPKSHRTFVER